MKRSGKDARSTYLRILGIENPQNHTQVTGTTNSQSGDRESVGQSSGPEAPSVPETPINLNPSPSSSPRTHWNLSLAEAAFVMEDNDEKGLFHVLKFPSEKGNPSKDKGR